MNATHSCVLLCTLRLKYDVPTTYLCTYLAETERKPKLYTIGRYKIFILNPSKLKKQNKSHIIQSWGLLETIHVGIINERLSPLFEDYVKPADKWQSRIEAHKTWKIPTQVLPNSIKLSPVLLEKYLDCQVRVGRYLSNVSLSSQFGAFNADGKKF